MIDPVGAELERRAAVAWPWRPALLAALIVHVAAAGAILLAGRMPRRPLLLPSVQVRLGVVPPSAAAPAPRPGAPRAVTTRGPAPARPAAHAAAKSVSPPAPAAHKTAPKTSAAAVPTEPTSGGSGAAGDVVAGAPAPGTLVAGGGGLALQAGGAGGGEPFPYDYYLQRLLGAIEANWYRPPAPDGSRCRVLCRIDRGGRLVESGIESPSGVAAFDRAALRAVYAAAPFPPLPQGFGGSTLTLHLDFGP